MVTDGGEDPNHNLLLGDSTTTNLIAAIDRALNAERDRSDEQSCVGCDARTAARYLCASCTTALKPKPTQQVCSEQFQSATYRPATPHAPVVTPGVTIVDPLGRLHVFSLPRPQITIGRSPSSDLAIFHPSVSYRHAVLLCSEAGWALHDLGSRTGVEMSETSPVSFQVARFSFGFRRDDTARFARYVNAARKCAAVEAAMGATSTYRPITRLVLSRSAATATITDQGGNEAVLDLSAADMQFRFLVLVADARRHVTTSEILDRLSTAWQADHVHNLVRDVRDRFQLAGFVGVIESKRGKGYRLAVRDVSVCP